MVRVKRVKRNKNADKLRIIWYVPYVYFTQCSIFLPPMESDKNQLVDSFKNLQNVGQTIQCIFVTIRQIDYFTLIKDNENGHLKNKFLFNWIFMIWNYDILVKFKQWKIETIVLVQCQDFLESDQHLYQSPLERQTALYYK